MNTTPNPAHELGQCLYELLVARYNQAEADAFVAVLTEPLRPSDPRRAAQDKALTTMAKRLTAAKEDVS